MRNSLLILFGWFLLGVNQSVFAQSAHLTSKNVSLGSGGAAYQDLYHANFVNPANLMLNHDRRPAITIGIAGGIYTGGGGDLLNISTYNRYLTTGLTIEGAVADEMLDKWFGASDSNIRSASFDAGVIPIGAVYRTRKWSVSFAQRSRVSGRTSYSRGFADLIFRGLDSEYFDRARAVNSTQELYGWHEISAGFAMTVYEQERFFGLGRNLKIHAGIAPKLLLGADYFSGTLHSDLRIEGVSAESGGAIQHNFQYSVQTIGRRAEELERYNNDRRAGLEPKLNDYLDFESEDISGFKGTSVGVDLGVTAELNLHQNAFGNLGLFRGEKKLTVGLAVTDIGALSFSDRARSFDAADNFTWNGFTYDQETIDNEFDGDESAYFESVLTDSIGNDIYGNFETRESSKHTVGLPAMVRLGSHLQLGKFAFMADIGTGIVDRGINSSRIHLSLGSEYRFLNRIPLRAGMRTGGYSSTTWHAGTGVELKNFEFTVGAATTSNSETNGASIAAAWSGIVVHF